MVLSLHEFGGSPWRRAPEAIPDDFINFDFDEKAWSDLPVPSNWTMHGFDRPQYTNVQMPFDCAPPNVPDDNPTGLYRTSFTVPQAWAGWRVVLHIGGAESDPYVWLNGRLWAWARICACRMS